MLAPDFTDGFFAGDPFAETWTFPFGPVDSPTESTGSDPLFSPNGFVPILFSDPIGATLPTDDPGFPLDPLDPADSLAIVEVYPGAGARLAHSPAWVGFQVNSPLPARAASSGQLILEREVGTGSYEQIAEEFLGPAERVSWDGTWLQLPLAGVLPAGRYRLSLSRDALIESESGAILDGARRAELLSEFEVLPSQSGPARGAPDLATPESTTSLTLADAVNLGPIGPNSVVVPGRLDASRVDLAVQVYRFTLDEGRAWRFGAEVLAQRLGSQLDAALALYDADGSLLRQAQLGRIDAVSDPYLFEGLAPGTYYLVVTPESLQPANGRYDPVDGFIARPDEDHASGDFELHLVADPVDQLAQLTGFTWSHDDPADATPTGLALRFNQAIRLHEPADGMSQLTSPTIEIVDQTGKVWGALLVGYEESTATVHYILENRLPAGQYTVRLPVEGGLSDLAGRPVQGRSPVPGDLFYFQVHETSTREPGDLGTLFPEAALEGVHSTLPVGEEGTASARFVVLLSGLYRFDLAADPPASLTAQLIDSEGGIVAEYSAEDFGINGVMASLEPGEYRLVLTGVDDDLAFSVQLVSVSFDNLLLNGLGQGPALNLRLVTPVTATPISRYGPDQGESDWVQPMPAPGGPDDGGTGSPVGASVTTALPLTWESMMLGRPADDGLPVASYRDGGPIIAMRGGTGDGIVLGQGTDLGQEVFTASWSSGLPADESNDSISTQETLPDVTWLPEVQPPQSSETGEAATTDARTGTIRDQIDDALNSALLAWDNLSEEPESREAESPEIDLAAMDLSETSFAMALTAVTAWMVRRRLRRHRKNGRTLAARNARPRSERWSYPARPKPSSVVRPRPYFPAAEPF